MTQTLTLITGGSRGIGNAIAHACAEKGSDLVLVSQTDNPLRDAAAELEARYARRVVPKACDLSSEREIDILAEYLSGHDLIPNNLVLSAGIFLEGSLLESKPDDYRKTVDVNLNAIYYLVRHLAPRMVSKANPRIVLIGSTAAYEAYPVGALYGVAKWALRGYAVNLRSELRRDGIGVTFVAPGGTLTDLWAGEELAPNRLLEPSDIGKLVATLLFELSSQAVVEELIVRPMLGDIHE